MVPTIEIGPMLPEESDTLYRLVERVSNKMVCRDFDNGGREEFFGAVEMMLFEQPDNHLVLVARQQNRPVGMVDIRDQYHICLFFVDLEAQGQGIGRALFDETLKRCSVGKRSFLEVNSSLFAVPVYEALGFRKTTGVRCLNGIRFVEMVYSTDVPLSSTKT